MRYKFGVADLKAIGYSNVKIVTATYEPESTEILIALRVGLIPNTSNYDFHFMKYRQSNGFWYHKPGNSAVLKYKADAKTTTWKNEYYNGSWYISDLVYNSSIKYIVYSY